MFSHLTGWRVNLSFLQEAENREFLEIIDRCEGKKLIVRDPSLAGPIDLIANREYLKERNFVGFVPLKDGPLPEMDVKNIIFITRPNLRLMDCIIENIKEERKKRRQLKKDFHLYFLPRQSTLCLDHLQERGIQRDTFRSIGDFRCEFFPIDNDLLSMELQDANKELVVEGDETCLYHAACGLVTLQKTYGRIPKIYGKGNFAFKVWELAKTMGRDEKNMFNSDKGAIDQMIILDRSIDLMSVLATQLTYEGLIDEIYGIKQTVGHFPSELFSQSNEPGCQEASETLKIVLNSGEALYAELRDKNFNAVGQILSRNAKSISSQLEERHRDKSVQDMKRFVERLPNMLSQKKSVTTHTSIAHGIKEVTDSNDFLEQLAVEQEFMVCADLDKPSSFIEDMIAKKADFRSVIRLICMQCIAGSGLKPKILDYYKRELVHVYGIEALLTIVNLERADLLKIQSESRTYAVLRKTMNLTVENAVEVSPKDISYVHSFYAPLSVRIVEQCLKEKGWQSLKGVLHNLPGRTFEDFQAQLVGIGGRRASLTSEMSQSEVPRVILVFFVGGCTFAEISALRFLATQEERKQEVEFIIATTKLINKNTFLDSFIECKK
uniref:Putative vacuolar sorting protein vps33/slp1 sec1 family n=1 Tax=Tabanus bromius TaxID=304241 RepID=A0A0K8TLY2_TABBR